MATVYLNGVPYEVDGNNLEAVKAFEKMIAAACIGQTAQQVLTAQERQLVKLIAGAL